MTSVVRVMTTTYRVKDPADADLPRSFEARSPAKEPGLLFFHRSNEHSAGAASTPLRMRSACSLTTRTERRAGSGPRSAHKRQAPRPSLGSPAPSRVCPRTSIGRPGVHVRSGGRLSRAAIQLWFAQASRIACGHSRDGSCFHASLAQWSQSAGLRSRMSNVRSDRIADQDAACCGPQAWRMAPALPHGVPPLIYLKPVVELTLRRAQTGRNDWAASEPVTDNLFQVAIAQSGRAPVCRTGGRGIEARWRRH